MEWAAAPRIEPLFLIYWVFSGYQQSIDAVESQNVEEYRIVM